MNIMSPLRVHGPMGQCNVLKTMAMGAQWKCTYVHMCDLQVVMKSDQRSALVMGSPYRFDTPPQIPVDPM
jgi:hypothetical protein